MPSSAQLRALVRRVETLEAENAQLRATITTERREDQLERQRTDLIQRIQAARVHTQPLVGMGQPCSPLAEAVEEALGST